MLLNDVNVKVVSERLGHASIQLTLDTYSHVLPTRPKIAAERMGAFFRRKTAPGEIGYKMATNRRSGASGPDTENATRSYPCGVSV
jgi:hypothetical protein